MRRAGLLSAPEGPTSTGLLILGDLSIQGNVKPVRSLVEPLPPPETFGPYDAYSYPERKSGGKGDRRKGDWRPWDGLAGRCSLGLVLPRGPWSRLEDLELATLEWVWWFNNHRLLKPIGLVPPAEYEAAYYLRLQTPPELETLNTHSLQ